MSANETMADIVAEMRRLSDTTQDGIISIKGNVIADRIEAAWKREKAEIEASALSVGGIVEASRQTGNAAAMRAVLVNIATEMIGLIEIPKNRHARFQPQAVLDEIKQVIPELEGV